ncbi:aspartyl protease [Rhizoctonia solani]|uniref:Aspartyl protease n=1 Tax=Rhizoctonia solani TaxID=456999 RepID=A0A8H8NZ28_9AGAM|nr:aspartyl protease [Rhizoctonia solani]QRW21513.1 aspartyl protease [Rhizoctonia solani]
MAVPAGVDIAHAQLATRGGDDNWYTYEGEIMFENVIVVDEATNKILLGYKKEGFGAGNYNPFAGPIAEGEDGSDAARRDLLAEEIVFHGTIRVKLPNMDQSLNCSMYKVTKWKGDLKDCAVLKMFDDDIHWIPLFLGPKKFVGRADFDKPEEGKHVGKLLRWRLPATHMAISGTARNECPKEAVRIEIWASVKGGSAVYGTCASVAETRLKGVRHNPLDPFSPFAMKSVAPKLALGLLAGPTFQLANALRIPVQRRDATKHTSLFAAHSTHLNSPPSLVSAGADPTDDSDITNFNNMFYTTNLTIAGVEVPVQLDTGSTDLWVYPVAHPGLFANVHNFTNVPVGVRYGKGSVDGHLAVTNVSFAGFDVDDQAFIAGTYGIMGLGFDTLSNIARAVQTNYNATWGRSLLSNLFLQEPNTPNHIAFALERANDLDDMAHGAFDIGEILPQYAAVNHSSPISLWPENTNRWTVLLDGMSVNSSPVQLNSTFEGDNESDPPEGKSLALLDTGASLGLLPKWAVDAIYGHIPGSVYLHNDGLWIIPYYQHLPFDFLLGDSFLRNVYAVYDFGDFDASGNMGKPYIKLLPLTDPVAASASFKKNRAATLAQLPSEGDASKLPGAGSPVPKSSTPGSASTPTPTAPTTTTTTTTTSAINSNAATNSKASSDPIANVNVNDDTDSRPSSKANLVSAVSDDDSEISNTLDKLMKLAPIALGLLGLNVVLLIGLIVMGGVLISKQRKQGKALPTAVAGSSTRGTYVPVTKFPEDDDERSHTPAGRYDMPQYRDNA